jgi:hypothetical protein
MDTTCIIIISSLFEGVCLFGSVLCLCKTTHAVVPKGSVIITKEHYDYLKKNAAELPDYEPEEQPPMYT